jgi:hypothetical protein
MIPNKLDITPSDIKSFRLDEKHKYLSPYMCMLHQFHLVHHKKYITFTQPHEIEMGVKLKTNMDKWLENNQNMYVEHNVYPNSILKNLVILSENMTFYDYIGDKTRPHYIDLYFLHLVFNISVLTYNFITNRNAYFHDKYNSHLIEQHKSLSFEQMLEQDNVYVLMYEPENEMFSLYTKRSYSEQSGGGSNTSYNLDILSKSQVKMFQQNIFPLATRLYVIYDKTDDSTGQVKMVNGIPNFTKFQLVTNDYPSFIRESITHDILYHNVYKFESDSSESAYSLYCVANTPRIQDIEKVNDIKHIVLFYKSMPVSIVNLYELTKKMSFVSGTYMHSVTLAYSSFSDMMNNADNGLTIGECKYSLNTSDLYIEGIGEIGKTSTPKERNFEIKVVKLSIGTDTYIENDLHDVYFDFTQLVGLLKLGEQTIRSELVQ